jgi:hypothetical protein
MRKTILRRLEALEKEDRSRKQRERSSLGRALVYIWEIVLAYHLGDLKSDEEDPSEAEARALKYPTREDYCEAILKVMRKKDIKDISEIHERYNDAYRRLFANVGLDFDSSPPSMLFDAFVTMVNQLPDQWLDWLRSNLREWCRDAEIAAGSNLPRGLSGDNLFVF